MDRLKSKSVICPIDQYCSQWARKYMGYCVCSKRDGFSVVLGLVSVMSWCVAEIPQIITNHKKKSAEGLSALFILTWIIGDVFNLLGCTLEPATLPTQYYMAVLYMATTLVLSAQALYYRLIYPRLKSNKRRHEAFQATVAEGEREGGYVVIPGKSSVEKWRISTSSPIPFPISSQDSSNEDGLYVMSARSLSVSHTPTAGSISAQKTTSSDIEQHAFREPLLAEVRSTTSESSPKPKTLLCVVFLLFFVGSLKQDLGKVSNNDIDFKSPVRGTVLFVKRQLLQEKESSGLALETSSTKWSGIGSLLGWGMTAIYLGGRLPQICLNFKRGSAEGLNPLMFVFAIIGNATYVASILVKSLEWSKLNPNLPWLVDAGGCMLLDTLIIFQFIYYRYRSAKEANKC